MAEVHPVLPEGWGEVNEDHSGDRFVVVDYDGWAVSGTWSTEGEARDDAATMARHAPGNRLHVCRVIATYTWAVPKTPGTLEVEEKSDE